MSGKIERQKQKDFIKAAILTATAEIVLRDGWQAVSIRKIADAIGYSLPVVYTHFVNKDAIQEELVREGFEMLTIAIQDTNDRIRHDQLVKMALNYYDFAFKNAAYYKMMFGLGIPSCQKAKEIEEIAKFSNIVIIELRKVMNTAEDQRVILKFHTFWSILHGLTSINMVNLTAAPSELQQHILLDAVKGFINNINH